MSTKDKQTDKETIIPDSNSQETTSLLQEIAATKELTQQEMAIMA